MSCLKAPPSRRTSSSYAPRSTMAPSAMTTTWSAWCTNCSWCVTRSTALSLNAPSDLERHLRNRSLATCASSALSGSSITTKSASAYTARAMAVRCFCPPDSVMPFSPISVRSPRGNSATSLPRQAHSSARAYASSSSARPNSTLSLSESDCTHATCATYEVVPAITGAPRRAGVPSGASQPCISPSSALMSADLPEPTGPTTTVSSPFRSVKSMSRRNGRSSFSELPEERGLSAVQWKCPPTMLATTPASSARGVECRVSSSSTSPASRVSRSALRAPRGACTSAGSDTVVASASGSRKYFCRRLSATSASATMARHRG